MVESGGRYFLVDAGLSARQLVRRMRERGVEPEQLEGILLTHEHGDHVAGLEVFCRKYEVPVFATALTQESLRGKVKSVASWKLFSAGQEFEVSGLRVESFAVPHDAVDPVGFVFEANGVRTGVVTDLGHVTPRVRERLEGVRAMLLESNYCDRMLEADVKRPWSLKQRISSRHGHLSNLQARELAESLRAGGLKRVVLGHLSRDCNHARVAREAFDGVELEELQVASQGEPTPWMRVVEPEPLVDEGGQLEFGSWAMAG